MILKRIASAGAILALAGAGVAFASNGVGPSPGTTGQDRVCQAFGANNGQSKGRGVECASFTITFSGTSVSTCFYSVTGTGFQPGTPINAFGTIRLFPDAPTVSGDGTFDFQAQVAPGQSFHFTGTTAQGNLISSETVTSPGTC